MEKLCSLSGPCPQVISRRRLELSHFCTRFCEERTRAREAEDFPLLEDVARKRLVKTQQAGKYLAGVEVICELWRLSVAL
jgi:hypothetical protein